jgi:hypothetical protein
LSWAFQILPYLEGQAIHNIKTDAALTRTDVPMFHCPSRRAPTRAGGVGPYLMDYASAVPLLMANEWSSGGATRYKNSLAPHVSWGVSGCQYMQMWNGQLALGPRFQVPPGDSQPKLSEVTASGSTTAASMGANYAPNMGVIVRSDYCALCPADKNRTGFYSRIGFENIEDGSSNTLVISEKKLEPQFYGGDDGIGHDDRGWSDGWDFDTIRMSICPPGPDENSPQFSNALPYSFGAAHASGINTGFADASVRHLSYEVDIEVFNMLAHRSDGNTLAQGSY